MAARRDPIDAADLRDELEALDEQAYRLQILRQRIDTSVGALHDKIDAHDMANVRAFVREAVALWDRISGIYESHTAAAVDGAVTGSGDPTESLRRLVQEQQSQAVNFRLPHVDAKETA